MTLGLLALLLASTAIGAEQAVDEAPAGPAAAPAAAPAAQAPDASVAYTSTLRPWLRATKPVAAVIAAPARDSSSPWRALGVLVVLGSLAGAAMVMRKKRATVSVLPESSTRVRVLSTARIGPKANAVVAEVGGRVILLGVTETNVARLAFLDRDAVRATPRLEAPPARAERPRISSEPVETADAELEPPPERGMASRFGEVLDRALGVKPPSGRHEFRANPGVAALLAAGVEDVVEARGTPRTTARMGSKPGVVVEEQVAGLKRQRRRS